MSEIVDMMSKKTFLDLCRGIEGQCADLYHYYSSIYEDIPEVSGLWKKTALEEENHAKQFELVIRLWNETEFDVLLGSMRTAYSIQLKLSDLLKNIRHTRPDPLLAISKAVEMEERLADLHAHISLKFKEESMQKLFNALNGADCDHIADLRRYYSVLYLPHAEINVNYQNLCGKQST